MCELVVRITDKAGANPQTDQIGDIIAARDDGFQWGSRDLSNPQWRVVSLPGVPVEDYTDCLVSVYGLEDTMIQYRAMGIDLNSIAVVSARLTSEPSPVVLGPAEQQQFAAAKYVKDTGAIQIG
jgi:hypothetical protein